MTANSIRPKVDRVRKGAQRLAMVSLSVVAGFAVASAQHTHFSPNNLVVSRSVYDNNPNNVTVGQLLPPNCQATQGGCNGNAINDGTYPYVWNNNLVDGSFGITSTMFLDQYTPDGKFINSLEIPNNSQHGGPHDREDQMVTSFSSKSELALNLSTDGEYLTFMGYVSDVDNLDVSNSNTPAVVDPTNPVGESYYRAVGLVDAKGKFKVTATNAYSGNNGRAVILNNNHDANFFYTAGNAGNGGNPQPDGIIIAAGAQILNSEGKAGHDGPGLPTPLASFNITQLGDSHDKIGKDDNFRGLRIFNNVIYYTKGSGGNGVNTVYFVDPTLTICNDSNGVGLPPANAVLPTAPLAYDPNVLQTKGLDPNNMCVLKGFPTTLKSTTSFPFGIWFADANTLYVSDEGNGDNTFSNGMYTTAASQTTAGLQKWIFDSGTGQWNLAYVLQSGLQLGVPYTVSGYPTGNNPATGLPWSPGTDGLRNITGIVNRDGTATIYGITSTVSGNGDQGADPNQLVTITDQVSATTLPTGESFSPLVAAGFTEVLRGISFTPGRTGGH
ncbi:MAG TPA: hypothetical protein VNZ03_37040 [Terriglobales bacterium]|nr:hypothetical protein [Terriglobales bacterium]